MQARKYVQVNFTDVSKEDSDLLVALLADIGYTGFEEIENSLKACIEEPAFSNDDLQAVLKMLPAVFSKNIIEEENWNAQWEQSFQPIIVNDFAAIRAAFHPVVTGVKQEIIITPKMSFGTGHHATTYMVVEQMEHIDFNEKQVFDFGTGTAVLAILAEKLGAGSVDAIDIDEWSIENSLENVAANNCTKISLAKADRIATGKTYDIILANINLNVILGSMLDLKAISKTGTKMLLSGFMPADEQEMIQALQLAGFSHKKTVNKGDWVCLLAKME